MPVVVKGLAETKRAMKQFNPEIYNQMQAEIKAVMLPVRDKARGYVPFKTMSGWMNQKGTWENRGFNKGSVEKGIKYSAGTTNKNDNGFKSAFYVSNNTAAGAIYETAGRANPNGQPWVGRKGKGGNRYSHSSNPTAGQTFIRNMQGSLVGADKQKGRLVYKAWAQDNGKVVPAVIDAINEAITKFNKAAQPK